MNRYRNCATGVLSLLALAGAASAQTTTPDYCGADSASQLEDVGFGGPFSHYLNPAHPGVAQMLGVTAPAGGLAAKTYGETLRDRFPLVDWKALTPPVPPPTACYDSGWSAKQWIVPDPVAGTSYCYRRRDVTLPSGASLTIFQAFAAAGCDDPPHSACSAFARDALVIADGYQGGMYVLSKAPPAYCPAGSSCAASYDGNPMYGLEIETPTNPWANVANVGWVFEGLLDHEALLAGATLVYVKPSTGFRPFFWHWTQIVEAGEWLDSTGYSNPSTLQRKFIAGGSYNGSIALGAAIHMPWLFQGAICAVGGPDHRAILDWGEATGVMASALGGVYWGGFVRAFDAAAGPAMLMLLTELEKGYGGLVGGQPTGIAGVNVDLGGLSLLSNDLGVDNFAKLEMPLVLLHGDEDHVFYTFSGRDLEAESGGLVIEKRVPLTAHGDFAPFVAWNLTNRVVHELFAAADAHNPNCVLPASPTQIGWQDQTAPTDKHRSTVFRDAVEKVTAVQPSQPDTSFTVTGPLATPAWKAFDVNEGLGAMSNLVFADVDGDASAEIVGCTARGDVVKLTLLVQAQGGARFVSGVRREWRVRTGEYLGPTELSFDPATHTAALLPNFGPLVSLNLVPDTAPTPTTIANNLPTATDDYNLGTWLRGLRRDGPNAYVFLNDEGELVRVSAGVVSKHYLEGGPGPLEIVGGETAVYCSAHGNLKRLNDISAATFGHPTSVADLSDHLYASPIWVRVLSTEISGVRYLVGTDAGIFGLTSSLQAAIQVPIPLESCLVASEGQGTVKVIGPALLSASQMHAFEIDLTAANPIDQIPVFTPPTGTDHLTNLPAQIAALVPVPTAFQSLQGVDATTGNFQIRWLASLHSGQLAFLGDPFAAAGAPHQEIGEPFGSAFGFIPDGANLIVVGQQGRTWKIDPIAAAVIGTETTDLSLVNKMKGKPSSGAVKLTNGVWGFYDGGAAYGNGGTYVGMPFPRWIDTEHPKTAFAGVQVVQPADLKLGIPNYPGFVSTNYWWQSVGIVSPKCVGGPLPAGVVLEPGNAAIWADLDGDGDKDLVSGTHGGRVLWFRNTTSNPTNPIPVMPATGQPTGELAYGIDTGDLGWPGDLGSKILSMDAADLDGDGREEVVLGIECVTDPAHPEHHLLEGSVYVVELVGSTLTIRAALPMSYGVVGVRLADLPGGTQHDIVVGLATGELAIVGFDPQAANPLSLRYRSGFVAPMLGAYGALAVFPLPGGSARRIVAGSAGGLFAFDVGP